LLDREALVFWIYKCNSRNHPHKVAWGDWNDFFLDDQVSAWGSTKWVPALAAARRGDTILAYQTDRNELVGLVRVVALTRKGPHYDLMLKPLRRIGVRVRPLKDADAKVSRIPALQPVPIRTLYRIDRTDAERLIRAAGLRIQFQRQSARAEALAKMKGAGFGSPVENHAVERAAIRHVTRHFRGNDWTVHDVSKKKLGYDLLCTRGKSSLHVEVKGIAGRNGNSLFTAGERRRWMADQSFVLALVTKAGTASPTLDLHRGPSSIAGFQFEPLSLFVLS